jgi:hypothetical protein
MRRAIRGILALFRGASGVIFAWYAAGMTRYRLLLLGCFALVACGKAQGAPLRSPALDYQPPPPESAADGEPVGADRTAPSDKLGQGVTTSGPAPGWGADKTGPTYDPKKRVGGAIDPAPESGQKGK